MQEILLYAKFQEMKPHIGSDELHVCLITLHVIEEKCDVQLADYGDMIFK